MLMQHVLYYAIIMEMAWFSYPRPHLPIAATQQDSHSPLQPISGEAHEKRVNVRGQPVTTQPHWPSRPPFSHKTTLVTFHRYSPKQRTFPTLLACGDLQACLLPFWLRMTKVLQLNHFLFVSRADHRAKSRLFTLYFSGHRTVQEPSQNHWPPLPEILMWNQTNVYKVHVYGAEGWLEQCMRGLSYVLNYSDSCLRLSRYTQFSKPTKP